MTVGNAVFCCIFTSFAVHYGWKMRGTVIGGEKGAMLPGMLAGLITALFAGDGIKPLFFIPAAAGVIGMSYGGIEPYGDSIALIEDPRYVKPNPKKGMLGLMLKGALWFSIGGGFIGMSFSAMGGFYNKFDGLIFMTMIICLQIIGYEVFNQPYDKEKKIHPKIYLSFESRDEWGSNVGVLAAIFLLAGIRKDIPAVLMASCGFVFGAVGWFVAMKLYHYTEHPFKNGKYLLGFFSEKHLVGGWGNMEYCLGTFGGLGIALGFVLSRDYIKVINNRVLQRGVFNPLGGKDTFVIIVMAVLFSALLAINIFEYICDSKGKKYNSFLMDCIERPLFNTLPFVLILMCSVTASKLMTAFMIVYVLFIKNSFDRFKPGKARNLFIVVSAVICVCIAVCCVKFETFSFLWLIAAGTVPYILCEVIWNGVNKRHGGWKVWRSLNSFTFTIILLSVQSIIIFALALVLNFR